MIHNAFRSLSFGTALAVLAASPAFASFEGFGKDIPLSSAARQIVPEGWTVDFGEGVDSSAEVSWSSAPDWQSALRNAVAKRGYSAQIGASSVLIVKSSESAPRPYAAAAAERPQNKPAPKRPSAAPAPAPAPEAKAEYHGGGGFQIRPYRSASGAGDNGRLAGKGDGFADYNAACSSSGFAVSPGQMLHPVLADWAACAGWNLVWNSEYDYRIEAAASFSGEFIDASTALVEAMADARPTITVDFYKGNRVLVVSNKSADEAN